MRLPLTTLLVAAASADAQTPLAQPQVNSEPQLQQQRTPPSPEVTNLLRQLQPPPPAPGDGPGSAPSIRWIYQNDQRGKEVDCADCTFSLNADQRLIGVAYAHSGNLRQLTLRVTVIGACQAENQGLIYTNTNQQAALSSSLSDFTYNPGDTSLFGAIVYAVYEPNALSALRGQQCKFFVGGVNEVTGTFVPDVINFNAQAVSLDGHQTTGTLHFRY
jgi:hypothetical protein